MTSVLKADASNELLNCDEPISSLFARPVSAVMCILVLFQLVASFAAKRSNVDHPKHLSYLQTSRLSACHVIIYALF